ncbi:MAG TPA: hypothetical protein PKB09_04570 [Candidatus Saccharibacteria bacterium]|nr:hypothetical protein [Candidatus Saccharibacteria bacterium]
MVTERESQVNFARVTDPAFWELDRADYEGVTARMIERADPLSLRSSLVNVPLDHGSGLSYEQDSGDRVSVGMTPDDYTLIHRSFDPKYASKYASNRTRVARARSLDDEGNELPPKPLTQEDIDAAHRAGNHIIESGLNQMSRYVSGRLMPEIVRIEQVSEYADNPGRRRKSEEGMREQVGWVRENVFGGMLSVIGIGREWTEAKAENALKTIEWRLFFDKEDNRHYEYWRNMLDLGDMWWGERINVFEDRIGRLQGFLQTNGE